MTKIDAALGTKLLAIPSVTAIVGTSIYYDDVPVGATLPALCLTKISEVPHYAVPDMYDARVQVSVWALQRTANGVDSPQAAEELAQIVMDAVNRTNLEKTVESWTIGMETYSVHVIRIGSMNRLRDPASEWIHIPIDVFIQFRRL
jgi:hypothetical protein